MEIKNISIEDIIPYENNPRINDKAVDKVAESIKEYGWKQPLVIDKENVIVVGHTRYLAALSLGIKQVPCLVADDLTEKQIRAYRIADNKTSDFSIWDNVKLLDELEGLEDMFTGFDINDFDGTVLDERNSTMITDDDFESMYEVVFRSKSADKIEEIKRLWEELPDEEDTGGGNIREETGD